MSDDERLKAWPDKISAYAHRPQKADDVWPLLLDKLKVRQTVDASGLCHGGESLTQRNELLPVA